MWFLQLINSFTIRIQEVVRQSASCEPRGLEGLVNIYNWLHAVQLNKCQSPLSAKAQNSANMQLEGLGASDMSLHSRASGGPATGPLRICSGQSVAASSCQGTLPSTLRGQQSACAQNADCDQTAVTVFPIPPTLTLPSGRLLSGRLSPVRNRDILKVKTYSGTASYMRSSLLCPYLPPDQVVRLRLKRHIERQVLSSRGSPKTLWL
jgi:hypothetical protein